jgi:lactoylglutathione lyase
MEIKLIVIRTPEMKRLADFYEMFDLVFNYHKHGNSPYHYSATIDKTVLEIYPFTKTQTEPDKNLRLGFTIDNFEATIKKLKNKEVKLLQNLFKLILATWLLSKTRMAGKLRFTGKQTLKILYYFCLPFLQKNSILNLNN